MIALIWTIVLLAACRPFHFYWEQWDGEHVGHCMNTNALIWSNAAVSIFMDLAMLVLPLTQLIQLNIHWRKKLGVILMFSVGSVYVPTNLFCLLHY